MILAMRDEVWVAGFPSFYGGADTELDHLIDLFRAHDVAVNLVPMFGADDRMQESVLARGCIIHEYRDDVFQDRAVVSFCNGEFLRLLPQIMAAGRPARVVWFNCMTWLFEAEREAHHHGWIDCFGFQSRYQRNTLLPQLTAIGPVRSFGYRPYFNAKRSQSSYREWEGCYRIGRISRDDKGKFAPDTWRIFDRVLVPASLQKKVYILGYGDNAAEKCGPPPTGLDWLTWSPNAIPSEEFYETISTLIHKTGGSRESYCRVVVEAYAHYVVPIVEFDYAFPELIIHGETGFMTSDSDEMSYYASLLANNPKRHRRMAEAGRRYLEQVISDEQACWEPWRKVLQLTDAAVGRL
jgi:glycosyltransferase involved in cell wall biosynthesis